MKIIKTLPENVFQQIKTIINGRMASLFAGSSDAEKMHNFRQVNGIAPSGPNANTPSISLL